VGKVRARDKDREGNESPDSIIARVDLGKGGTEDKSE